MIKLYFDGQEIEKDYYRSLSQSYILFDKSFCLGSVPSNTFKVGLNSKANINDFDHVKIELDDEDYAHVFYDNIDNSNGSKNIISLSDKMVDFEFGYDASPLIEASENGYVTLLDILEDICDKRSIKLATKDFNLKDMQISWYDNTITARQYISFIATLNGGFAKINRKGELELVRYTNDIKAEVNVNTCLDYKIGEYHKITRVVWDIGVEKWEYGDETGNTLYLDTDNSFITKKEDVESIYNLINGFEFYSMEISKCPIDSSVDIGDVIAFRNGDELYPFIAQLELSYNGGFHGGYKFVVNTEKIEETSVNNTEKNIKSIKSRLNRDEAQLEIIAEETKETQKNINDLSTLILEKEGNNNLLIEEAKESNSLEYNIKGKSEQETRSGKNLLNVNSFSLGYISSDGKYVSADNNATFDYIEVNPSKYYTASCKRSIQGLVMCLFDKDKGFISRTGITGSLNTILTTSETKYIRIFINVDGTTLSQEIINSLNLQLEEGDKATDYEPYGASPSPDYPSEIKTIKGIRNYFYGDLSNGYLNHGFNSDPYWKTTDFLEVTNNCQYTINAITTATRLLYEEYTDKNINSIIGSRSEIKPNTPFITKATTKYIRFSLNDTSINKNTIMLEKGSVAHSYVPYGTWLKAKTNGKNLFDNITTKQLVSTEGSIANNNSWELSDYISVTPLEKYTFSREEGTQQSFLIIEYDKDKNFIRRNTQGIQSSNVPYELIIGNTTSYVRLNYNSTFGNTNFQFEKGNLSTYEPYKEQDILVDMNKYDNNTIIDNYELCSNKDLSVRDNLEVISGKLTKEIEKIVFDGTENWENANNGNLFLNSNLNYKKFQDGGKCICSHFKYGMNTDNHIWVGNGSFIVIRVGTDYSVDAFKAFLKEQYDNGTPVTVYYELAEPEEIQLTPTEVPLFEGINHITLLEDIETDTSIKYYKKNAFSDAFYTKEESNTLLRLTSDKILGSVSETTTKITNDLTTTQEKVGSLELKSNEFNVELSKKVNNDVLTGAELMLRINNDQSEAKLKADKFTIEGYTTINGNVEFTTDGRIIARSGQIGGAAIDTQGICFNNGNTGWGLWGTTAHDGIVFHAGANSGNIGDAPLRMYHDGRFICYYAFISGTINATGGTIGGAHINSQGMWFDSGETGWGLWGTTGHGGIVFHAGANGQNIGGAPLRMYHDGLFVCNNAVISGTINATSGNFSGTINTAQDAIVGNNLYIGQNQSSSAIDDKFIYFNNSNYIRRTYSSVTNYIEMVSGQVSRIRVGQSYIDVMDNQVRMLTSSGGELWIYGTSIYATSDIIVNSDKRLKQDIKNINVSWIENLDIKEYKYKTNPDVKHIGIIAQDYIGKDGAEYFLRKYKKDDEDYYGVAYGNITIALVKYCQDMKRLIKSQQNIIEDFRKRIEVIENETVKSN